MNLDLSILVVTYRNADMVAAFHESLLDSLSGHENYELLYRDHTPDSSVIDVLERAAARPQHSSRDADNPGFSAGVNHLLRVARHRHILLLNPDVSGFTFELWPSLLTKYPVGQVMFIRLLDASGRVQDCVGRELSLRRAITPRLDHDSITEPTEVDNGIMAFMLTDRPTFNRVGPLDEDYPLYGEDMDWCFRARAKGIALIYDPRLMLTHAGGASADTTMTPRQQKLAKYRSERIFIHKHFVGLRRWTLLLLNRVKLLRAW